jgi:hypothetical protein
VTQQAVWEGECDTAGNVYLPSVKLRRACDEGPSSYTSLIYHEVSNQDVFSSLIASNTVRSSELGHTFFKQCKDCLALVVVFDP